MDANSPVAGFMRERGGSIHNRSPADWPQPEVICSRSFTVWRDPEIATPESPNKNRWRRNLARKSAIPATAKGRLPLNESAAGEIPACRSAIRLPGTQIALGLSIPSCS